MKNPDFKVGITSLGDLDTIAPAVQKGNKELLAYINDEIKIRRRKLFPQKLRSHLGSRLRQCCQS